MSGRVFLTMVAAAGLAVPAARADSDWLAGTQWYVPEANVLAYLAPGTDLSTPVPVHDQTLWNITSASGGTFAGESSATLTILGTDTVSTSSMSGILTPEGQVRIVFTPNGESAGGPVTVGIGQLRDVGFGTQIEMQMLTGSGSSYVTHWAYMTQVPVGAFTPPTEYDGSLLSTEWAWMEGSEWSLAAPEILGGPAEFSVAEYHNGYFWGTGVGPAGEFSHIGSVTPEGNVLFNFLVDGTLTSLAGVITGDAATGSMLLREYEGTDVFGPEAVAMVVPEPAAMGLLLAALAVAAGVGVRRRISRA